MAEALLTNYKRISDLNDSPLFPASLAYVRDLDTIQICAYSCGLYLLLQTAKLAWMLLVEELQHGLAMTTEKLSH